MLMTLNRILSNSNETIGVLNLHKDGKLLFECFVLEDEHRNHKVMHKTRISAGTYEIKLRTAGRIHKKYKMRFHPLHRGVLHLQDVPNFTWIYIHCGNSDEDTSGCLLVGYSVVRAESGDLLLRSSTTAYMALYKKILDAMDKGETVNIEIIDKDEDYFRGSIL